MAKKMTEKQDKAYDKAHKTKENSKKDLIQDKKMGVFEPKKGAKNGKK